MCDPAKRAAFARTGAGAGTAGVGIGGGGGGGGGRQAAQKEAPTALLVHLHVQHCSVLFLSRETPRMGSNAAAANDSSRRHIHLISIRRLFEKGFLAMEGHL